MTCLTKYPHGRIRMTIHMPRVSIWDGVDIDKKKRKWTWKIQTLINREYIHNYCKSKKEAVRIPLKHIALDLWELNHIKESVNKATTKLQKSIKTIRIHCLFQGFKKPLKASNLLYK